MENDCPGAGVAQPNFFRREAKAEFLRKNGGKERNTRQCHLNRTTIKATKFGMTLLLVRISEVSFKIGKIARFYDLDHITTTTTGYLKKFQDGLRILAVRG